MDNESPLDEKLPYQTRPMYFPNGASVEEFIIPDEDRELVLEQLYPFAPVPKLSDVMYDIHADKTFIVRDFRVTWEHGMNYLVSPYYPESGGTVIDWWDENWNNDETDDDELGEEFDDDFDGGENLGDSPF
ncbi:MAG TPA: hypothetical protein VN653_13190 [Anaerolineales bacterium]|nr:hypothetical protein [Anaerolineales bacterium]